MATYKNKQVRMRILRQRGRIPCKPAFTTKYLEIKTKSQAGVEYTHYKPVLVRI